MKKLLTYLIIPPVMLLCTVLPDQTMAYWAGVTFMMMLCRSAMIYEKEFIAAKLREQDRQAS